MPARSARSARSRPRRSLGTAVAVVSVVLATLLATVLATALATVSAGPVGASTRSAAGPSTQQPRAAKLTAPALADRIKAALAAKRYPATLTPKLGDYFGGMAVTMSPEAQCLNPDDLLDTTQCTYKSPGVTPTKTALVLGDSVAASIIPGVLAAIGPEGYQIHGLALGGCPVADVDTRFDFAKGASDRCNRSHHLLYAQVQRMDPDLLIMTDSASGLQRLLSGNRKEAAVQEWVKGERSALSRLTAPGRKLVILAPNPVGGEPRTCYVDATSTPDECELPVQPWWYGKRRAERLVAAEFGAKYVNTLEWYSAGSMTPVFVGGTTMRWDQSHITAAYSRLLAPLLRDAILGT